MKVLVIIAALSLVIMMFGCKKKVGSNVKVVEGRESIVEGWVDDETWRTTAFGQARADATSTAVRAESSKNAALVMAQKRAQEFFTETWVEATSGAVDGESMGSAVRTHVQGLAKGGSIVSATWNDDHSECQLVYEVAGKNLKKDAEAGFTSYTEPK